MSKSVGCITICLIALCAVTTEAAAQSSFGWGWENASRTKHEVVAEFYNNQAVSEEDASGAATLISTYRAHESRIAGHRCPCLPTCSIYTMYSMQRYGFFVGLVMGIERLYIRENLDLINRYHYVSTLDSEGVSKAYDPPEANFILGKYDWRIVDPVLDILRIEHLRSSDATSR